MNREQMVRDVLANQLCQNDGYYWDGLKASSKAMFRENAHGILNLTDSKGKLLGVIAEDQSRPKNPYRRAEGGYDYEEQPYEADAYDNAQEDMAGFVKTEKGE